MNVGIYVQFTLYMSLKFIRWQFQPEDKNRQLSTGYLFDERSFECK